MYSVDGCHKLDKSIIISSAFTVSSALVACSSRDNGKGLALLPAALALIDPSLVGIEFADSTRAFEDSDSRFLLS